MNEVLLFLGAISPAGFFWGISCKKVKKQGREAFIEIVPHVAVILILYILQVIFFLNWKNHLIYSMFVFIFFIFFVVFLYI